ncbi:hypothetical protein C0991_011837 [Blastosporella zonata]|nr:hypothetical protein C0991_011837 [Blastosporella zonata]
MPSNGPTVNVEHALLKSRSFRRRPGDIPYPVQHAGASCSVFDVWNNMLRTTSLTLHHFKTPPPVVLDLGCGSGYWVIEAAKKWKESAFVGFDIKNIQPRLHHAQTLKHHKDIAHRVKWVHGNLLDGLPFAPDQFDFVRVVNIGLGVPEDEVHHSGRNSPRYETRRRYRGTKITNFLNPAHSDGFSFKFKVIEEDPIFPCGQPFQQLPPLKKPAPSLVIPSSGFLENISSATIWSHPLNIKLDERYDIASPHSSTSLSSLMSSPTTPVSAHPFTPTTPVSAHPSGRPFSPPNSDFSTPPHHPYLPYSPRQFSTSQVETDGVPDLRDHSRLKAAWNAMLASRFIAENLLSVLPFYLSSSFVDVQSHPPNKVLLPPNSKGGPSSSPQRSSSESNSSLASPPSPIQSTWTFKSAASSTLASFGLSTSSDSSLHPYTSDYAQMHLAKTVYAVSGCKEAIWQEYKSLYDLNVTQVVTPQPGVFAGHVAESSSGNIKSSIRESFDDEWAAWSK